MIPGLGARASFPRFFAPGSPWNTDVSREPRRSALGRDDRPGADPDRGRGGQRALVRGEKKLKERADRQHDALDGPALLRAGRRPDRRGLPPGRLRPRRGRRDPTPAECQARPALRRLDDGDQHPDPRGARLLARPPRAGRLDLLPLRQGLGPERPGLPGARRRQRPRLRPAALRRFDPPRGDRPRQDRPRARDRRPRRREGAVRAARLPHRRRRQADLDPRGRAPAASVPQHGGLHQPGLPRRRAGARQGPRRAQARGRTTAGQRAEPPVQAEGRGGAPAGPAPSAILERELARIAASPCGLAKSPEAQLTRTFVRNGVQRRTAQIIIEALKHYGAIVVERSASPTLYAQRNARWKKVLPMNVIQDIKLGTSRSSSCLASSTTRAASPRSTLHRPADGRPDEHPGHRRRGEAAPGTTCTTTRRRRPALRRADDQTPTTSTTTTTTP